MKSLAALTEQFQAHHADPHRAPTYKEMRKLTLAALRAHINAGWHTERSFARITHISQTHIHHMLNGKRPASIEMLDRMCRAARIDSAGRPTN